MKVKKRMIGGVLLLLTTLTTQAANKDLVLEWDNYRGSSTEAGWLIDTFLQHEELSGALPMQMRGRLAEIVTEQEVHALLQAWSQASSATDQDAMATLLGSVIDARWLALCDERWDALSSAQQQQLVSWVLDDGSVAGRRWVLSRVVQLADTTLRKDNHALMSLLDPLAAEAPRVSLAEIGPLVLSQEAWQRGLAAHWLAGRSEEAARAWLRNMAPAAGMEYELLEQIRQAATQQPVAKPVQRIGARQAVSQEPEAIQSRELDEDEVLANRLAPVVRLSSGGLLASVNLKTTSYPYVDYLPMSLQGLMTHPQRQVAIVAGTQSYPLTATSFEQLDQPPYLSSKGYLDFKALSARRNDDPAVAYRQLNVTPTLYYRVYRAPERNMPLAVQFWLFYFNNKWWNQHLGDWETMTLFLDAEGQGVEATYSTHYEARRASWRNLTLQQGHPELYVSNGGHGSYYKAGSTDYSFGTGLAKDMHNGNQQALYPQSMSLPAGATTYQLQKLDSQPWLAYAGRWGDSSVAPQGPRYRVDAPTASDWNKALNKPRTASCQQRLATPIYADPWLWSAGYGLDDLACQ